MRKECKERPRPGPFASWLDGMLGVRASVFHSDPSITEVPTAISPMEKDHRGKIHPLVGS